MQICGNIWKNSVPVTQVKVYNHLFERVSSYKYLARVLSSLMTLYGLLILMKSQGRWLDFSILSQFYT